MRNYYVYKKFTIIKDANCLKISQNKPVGQNLKSTKHHLAKTNNVLYKPK